MWLPLPSIAPPKNLNVGIVSIVTNLLAWTFLLTSMLLWDNYYLPIETLDLINITLYSLFMILGGVSILTFIWHAIICVAKQKVSLLFIINLIILFAPYLIAIRLSPN